MRNGFFVAVPGVSTGATALALGNADICAEAKSPAPGSSAPATAIPAQIKAAEATPAASSEHPVHPARRATSTNRDIAACAVVLIVRAEVIAGSP
ncbi:MAG: hypothetical protein IPK66_10400 [Rhodospirillales bacterium]|nr:hypothetical protein [Rhodospirillales bacterium]